MIPYILLYGCMDENVPFIIISDKKGTVSKNKCYMNKQCIYRFINEPFYVI